MKSVKKKCEKKSVKAKDGRDPIEVEPGENLNVDKESMSYSEYQRTPQSRSKRYTKTVKKSYRAPRTSLYGTRKKKL
jgi:hypothetical protein